MDKDTLFACIFFAVFLFVVFFGLELLCSYEFWKKLGKLEDFFEENYYKFWFKHKSKKYILKKIENIDKRSRKGQALEHHIKDVFNKNFIALRGVDSFENIFEKQALEKKRENCIQTLKYILGVIEKYPLLEKVREALLTELVHLIFYRFPQKCSFSDFEVSFNGFNIISITFNMRATIASHTVVVFDKKTERTHKLQCISDKGKVDFARTLLRKIEPPEEKEVSVETKPKRKVSTSTKRPKSKAVTG